MKITITLCALLIVAGLAHAQSPIKQTGITGKWQLILLSSKDKIYYNAEKDSIWVGSAVFEQIANMAGGQQEAITAQMKQSFKNRSLQFNSDGTYTATGERLPESGTYTFNEAEQMVTTKNANTQVQKSYHLTPSHELSLDKSADGKSAISMNFKKVSE